MSMVLSVAGSSTGYDITIEKGLLSSIGERVRPLTNAVRICIVSDSNVAPLYLSTVAASFQKAGFETSTFSFSAGEPSKNLETVTKILEVFCLHHLTRGDLAVALGGGVTGDLTGFAAAIYLRGIDFIQIPTSLLAQVDSSVGGKTGCDLPFGKNLCGAFHNPLAVFIDPKVLTTLPELYRYDGMAEIIKAGAILRPELFAILEGKNELDLETIITAAVEMKAAVVEEDFTEQGKRTLLNFGHTLGHAIERYQNYRGLSHGQAVAVGMVQITKAAEQNGLTEQGTAKRLERLCKYYHLPTEIDIPTETLVEYCVGDKKSRGKEIRLVLLKNIGESFVYPIAFEHFADFLKGRNAL